MAFTYLTVGADSPQVIQTVAAPVTSCAATTVVDRTLTIPQATPDMMFFVNWPQLDAGLMIGGVWCETAGQVKLRLFNQTGSPIVPAAQTLKVIGF